MRRRVFAGVFAMRDIIKSRENPNIKRLCALLTQKKERDETGLFVLEGSRLCLDACKAGIDIESFFLTQQVVEKYPELENMVDLTKTIWIDETLCRRIGDTKSPQGVFAIAKKPNFAGAKNEINGGRTMCAATKSGKYLLLAGLQDPGNLGGILRTACALGIDGVLVSQCPDLYSPKVVRAAMGAVWRVPVIFFTEPMEMIKHAKESCGNVYAAALSGNSMVINNVNTADGCAVLIGNEGAGLSEDLVGACDESVIIPMSHGADSLNAASAAAILMWEMMKG